jgi:chromosome segregation ATPase
MGSAEIRSSINSRGAELERERERLRRLNEKLEVLEDFSAEAKRRAMRFQESLDRRRKRVGELEPLNKKVRAAAAYSAMASDVLSGAPYQKAAGSISEMSAVVDRECRGLERDIDDARARIRQLENEIDSLRYSLQRALDQEREAAARAAYSSR